VRAPVDGVVLTPHPERRVGARVEAGDPVLLVGRTDSLELEFRVDEREVVRVREGQRVRLRVDAVPQRTFEARLHVLGRVPADSAPGEARFAARALVANGDGLLRAGMAAHARVLTDDASLATRMLRTPWRALRLFWWRLWG
jgi:multidrug efflux pump subunit AcrA (membrane-fusion protein)